MNPISFQYKPYFGGILNDEKCEIIKGEIHE
jgi:hypothetical protein